MQLSAFNLYVHDYPEPGQTLVHNTFSGAFAIVARADVEALAGPDPVAAAATAVMAAGEHDGPGAGEARDAAARALAGAPELADPDVGVLVASRDAERADYERWFRDTCATGAVLQSIVCVNLACNFECPYCCQADVMTGQVMDADTIARAADWLAARAAEIGARRVHVTFVGGEPLLHPERVAALARRLIDRLRPDGDDGGGGDGGGGGPAFSMGLITNGYFLTEDVVVELAGLGLVGAKVTIDGDHTTHCRTRVSRRGEDTFARVFDNAIAASRHIAIHLNGNYQDNTIAGFGPLVDRLADAGLPEGSRITLTPALAILDAPAGSGSGACSWSGSNHAYQVALFDRVVGRGFAADSLLAAGPCAFHDRHMYAIGPDGTLYKCPGFLGHREWGIGSVAGGLDARYHALVGADPQRACGDCAHRPNCAGGCVAHEYLRRGRAEGVNCERAYLDAVTRDAVVRDWLLATAEDADAALAEFPPAPRALPGPGQDAGRDREQTQTRTQTQAQASGRAVRPAALRVL